MVRPAGRLKRRVLNPGVAAAEWQKLQNFGSGEEEAVVALRGLMCESDWTPGKMMPVGEHRSRISRERWATAGQKLATHVDARLNTLIRSNPSEDKFAREVLHYLKTGSVFSDDIDRAFGLFWILIDPRIPYFHLDGKGMRMNNAKFRQLSEELEAVIARIHFIRRCGLEQRTQVASLVLSILDRYRGRRRAVLAAHAIEPLGMDSELVALLVQRSVSPVSAEATSRALVQ